MSPSPPDLQQAALRAALHIVGPARATQLLSRHAAGAELAPQHGDEPTPLAQLLSQDCPDSDQSPALYFLLRRQHASIAALTEAARSLTSLWPRLLSLTPAAASRACTRLGLFAAAAASHALPPSDAAYLLDALGAHHAQETLDLHGLAQLPSPTPAGTLPHQWQTLLNALADSPLAPDSRAEYLGIATLAGLWSLLDPTESTPLAACALNTLPAAMHSAHTQSPTIALSNPDDAALAMKTAHLGLASSHAGTRF